MTRAVIYIPPDAEFDQLSKQLGEYCMAKHYEIDSIHGAGPDVEWDDVRDYAHDNDLVIVVADAAHIPADRLPRVEVADPGAARPDLAHIQPEPGRRQRPRPA